MSSSNTSTRAADKSDSSSDYYDDEDENETRNVPSTVSAPPMLDIPSTSTGITANGFLFRMAATNHDSDDDDDDDDPQTNQDHSVNDGASTSMQFRNGYSVTRHNNNHLNNNNLHTENGRRKYRNQDDEHEDYASTTNNSTSMLSSSSSESSSNDSYPDYFCKKRKLNNGVSGYKLNDGASTSTFLVTPSKAQDDSGIDPSSSSSSKGAKVPNGTTSFESFKKIEEIKRNYRKNMQTSDDSD